MLIEVIESPPAFNLIILIECTAQFSTQVNEVEVTHRWRGFSIPIISPALNLTVNIQSAGVEMSGAHLNEVAFLNGTLAVIIFPPAF